MSGGGSGSGTQQAPQAPWAGVQQQIGSQTAQATPGSAAPPIPGITPGTAPQAPYRGPTSPMSGFTQQSPQQAVNPIGMQSGMPQVNAQTGTGNYAGAPPWLTAPMPQPTGYGIQPQPPFNQQQGQQQGYPPVLGMPR